ncbi:hypothetical protein HPB50_023030 [Hyalomma asiaticum]|uniref:Uncharacterized protein n=1 Tax=Hyalomma asiaticum TaxID=266040 RepID=A0ACB7SKQ4_HYAAI|nr:hypothetical protein HPB50_023030 [Hyalomma asiaticum]
MDNFRKHLRAKDCISVQQWVERMHTLRDNPVLFFKNQGQPDRADILDRHPDNLLGSNDFMLALMTAPQEALLRVFGTAHICVHSMRAMAGKQFRYFCCLAVENAPTFNSSHFLCVDEFGAGFPAAYCITNRTDKKAMLTFFASVKSKTGHLSVEVFLTDGTFSMYDAWSEVMELPQCRLLCMWHAKTAWRQTVDKYVRNKQRKAYICKEFESAMEQPDSGSYNTLLEIFLDWCDREGATKPGILMIKDYVEYNYVGLRDAWEDSFRNTIGIDATMRHVALHKAINYCYPDNKTNRRIDKLLSVLLKLTRNKVMSHLPRFIEVDGENEYRESRISRFERDTRIRHERGKGIRKFHVDELTSQMWSVHSESSYNVYLVIDKGPCETLCTYVCTECKICIHTASCTCADYLSRKGICKHIHAVFRSEDIDRLSGQCGVQDPMDVECSSEGSDDVDEIEDLVDGYCSPNGAEEQSKAYAEDRDCVTMLRAIIDHMESPRVQEQVTPWLAPVLSKILVKLDCIPPAVRDAPVTTPVSLNIKGEEQNHSCSSECACKRMAEPALVEEIVGGGDTQPNGNTQLLHSCSS